VVLRVQELDGREYLVSVLFSILNKRILLSYCGVLGGRATLRAKHPSQHGRRHVMQPHQVFFFEKDLESGRVQSTRCSAGGTCEAGSMAFLQNNFRCPPMLGTRKT